MSRITGNKGEWSELYVLLELLASGRLYAADDKLKKLTDVYFPILKIFRDEEPTKQMQYILENNRDVELYINGVKFKDIPRTEMKKYAELLYSKILVGGDRAFEIEESDQIMTDIGCSKIKAPSTDKTDIKMQLQDINTGITTICGFSIKSELGSAPTLLNAGRTTNFIYELPGVTENIADYINSLDNPKSKITDRVAEVEKNGGFVYISPENTVFRDNLMLIDSMMDEIVGKALLIHYGTGISSCKQVVEKLESENPLGFPHKGYYEYKFKKFLCSVALGMSPGRPWNGRDEANGGYIVVTTTGDVLAYHLYNRDFFEQYLLDNTKFERASTTRHGYASTFEDDGKYYMNLNLQIRFIK